MTVAYIWHTRRLEKKRFSEYLEPPTPLILQTIFWGFLGGIAFSFLLSLWSFSLTEGELILIWVATLLLGLWKKRLACFGYAIGLVSVFSLIFQKLNWVSPNNLEFQSLWSLLLNFHHFSWLWVAAMLHFIEWILIRWDGDRGKSPLRTEHQSGQIVDGYRLSKTWPIPLLLLTPGGWLPIPALLSFGQYNVTKTAEQQKRLSSTHTLIFALGMMLLLFISTAFHLSPWLVALFSVLGHEFVYQWGKWHEKRKEPFYVSGEGGLKVLAVLPGSPATTLGLKVGQIIQRINGVRINTPEDLKRVAQDAAFCKLEVLDDQLDRHIMQKALFEDDPRHLGVVGASPYEGKRERRIVKRPKQQALEME